MEKMLVAVFDNESKAYQGSRALAQLDAEGSITIHAESIIKKNADGTVTVEQFDGDFPVLTVGGTAIGSLVGLLGGPVGMGVGAAAGALAGSIGDLHVAGVNAEFLDQVSAALEPGKCAVLADFSEEWVTPVNTRMEPLGGVVFRTLRKSFEDEQRARDVAVLRAEIAELKSEHARARADRKAKIQARHRRTQRQAAGQVRRSEAEIGADQERNRSQDQSASEESRPVGGGDEGHPGRPRHSDPERLRANGGQAEALGRRTTEGGSRAARRSEGVTVVVPRDAVFDQRASRGPARKRKPPGSPLSTLAEGKRGIRDQRVQFDRVGADSFAPELR